VREPGLLCQGLLAAQAAEILFSATGAGQGKHLLLPVTSCSQHCFLRASKFSKIIMRVARLTW
jgi:hypothetical protein